MMMMMMMMVVMMTMVMITTMMMMMMMMQLRYGQGLYFSRTSSKSNDYAAGSERELGGDGARRAVRAMFLCKVVIA